VDLVLHDLKHIYPSLREQYISVSNEMAVDNAKSIYHELHIPMLARIPVIPGYNDLSENIEKTATLIIQDLGPDIKVHLLSYHRLSESKYERMVDHERLRSLNIEPPEEDRMSLLMGILEFSDL
jgi:pyruvate formate lyase activating enzyme